MTDHATAPSLSCDSPLFLACSHCRLIDEVLAEDGKESGQVRCLECGAVFDDPYRRPE